MTTATAGEAGRETKAGADATGTAAAANGAATTAAGIGVAAAWIGVEAPTTMTHVVSTGLIRDKRTISQLGAVYCTAAS